MTVPTSPDGGSDAVIGLPYAWPSARGRIALWLLRLVLLPVFVAIPYVFANYPVDKYFLHTEGRVVDGWVAAVVAVALCYFMLVSDGSSVRADGVRLTIRAKARQHDYSWGDVAAVEHTDTALVVTEQQGQARTIELVQRTWQARLTRRKSPMTRLAADLERIRRQVRAPRNLTPQVRVGVTRLTSAEWVLVILVAVGAVAFATLRTLAS